MRKIHSDLIVQAVSEICIESNRSLPADIRLALAQGHNNEKSAAGREVFRQLKKNYELAELSALPLCQDTGLAIFLVELGQDLHIEGLNLRKAINEGVRKGYSEGFLRKSVCDPFSRANTGDNSPAIIHFDIVPGDELKISFMPKGGGSENMSSLVMLAPSAGWKGIRKEVLLRVAKAGSNPCPPIIVGLGIGASVDWAPILAKKALLRDLGDKNSDAELALMEESLLADINSLGIGPMGLGGEITALGVKIITAPCHIASLPLAINIQCHCARHQERIL